MRRGFSSCIAIRIKNDTERSIRRIWQDQRQTRRITDLTSLENHSPPIAISTNYIISLMFSCPFIRLQFTVPACLLKLRNSINSTCQTILNLGERRWVIESISKQLLPPCYLIFAPSAWKGRNGGGNRKRRRWEHRRRRFKPLFVPSPH